MFKRVSILVGALSFVALTFVVRTSSSQQGERSFDSSLQITTQEHLQTETWWPTKATAPLSSFAGSDSCTHCHTDESGQPSSMQHAATVAGGAKFLKTGESAALVLRPFSYSLTADANGFDYSVSNGSQKFSHKLDWVMGAGDLGRTFLYQQDGRWFQSEATYYTHLSALDITTGLGFEASSNIAAALGQPLSASDARACFGCHTVHSTTSTGFNPLHAEAGLGCEACHGPARSHVSKMSQTLVKVTGESEAGVFNPAKLSPADSNDFCGSCHRSFADAALSLGANTSTAAVRFQPYRLEESKCWRATQSEKLTCTACHNPHAPLNRDSVSYDRNCLSCHAPHLAAVSREAASSAGKVCPKATKDCVTCHMPKVNVASMHGDFTDHFIRIVVANEAFPK